MHIPFEQLSDHSRVWIYASQSSFTQDQLKFISNALHAFTDDWQAHGTPLKASFEVKYNQFIIIGVDETHHAPSGCSIDKSVQIIKNIESELRIDLMNRMIVYMLENNSVQPFVLKDFNQLIAEDRLRADSQVFDNTITSFSAFQKEWIKPAKSTWIQRYFKQEKA